MQSTRIKNLQHILIKDKIDALLVTNPKNIFYLSNFYGVSETERESVLFVTQKEAFLFIPRMYSEHATSCVYSFIHVITELKHGLFGSFVQYAKKNWTIACESQNITLAEHHHIQKGTGVHLHQTTGLIEELRLIKEKEEIKSLKQAAQITDQTFAHILTFIQHHLDAGIFEQDIIDELKKYSRSIGSEKCGFDPIVAVGKGSAEPHYISKNHKLERGHALLIDMGFVVGGYTSDFTRTIFLGKAPEEFKKIYELVLEAQLTSIQMAQPGIHTNELHKVSARIFRKADKEHLYLHSLGHGVGLNIHEAPSISPRSDSTLKAGMIITIEPGLYLPNKFGVRIEDLAHVTNEGLELLTHSSKKLIQVI